MQASLLCSYFVHQVTNLRITDSVALPKPIDLQREIPRSDDQKKLVLQSQGDSFHYTWKG